MICTLLKTHPDQQVHTNSTKQIMTLLLIKRSRCLMETITVLTSVWTFTTFHTSTLYPSQHAEQSTLFQKTSKVPALNMHVIPFVFPGLNRTSTFSCEAYNRKGVATSGSGTITGRCHIFTKQPLSVDLNVLFFYAFILSFLCLSLFSSVLPSQPSNLTAVEITQTSLRLSWQPGFGGDYPIIRCSVQVRRCLERGDYDN